VLISSQLPVGSIRRLEQFGVENLPALALDFACSPENLRLGKSLEVFLKPDRIVIGTRSAEAKERLARLFGTITERIEWMTVESAEMTKHAINAFLATSVTFANEIAAICETVGADAREVARGLKTDHRIGAKAYLSPGGAFAGGTLARDITFLNRAAEKHHLRTLLLASVKPSNDEHKLWVRRRLQALFADLKQVVVAVWGLTYKAGTDTLRRSMAVDLCEWLIQQGAIIHAHDPMVRDLPAHWLGKVKRYEDAAAAVADARVLVVATEWPIYRDIKIRNLPVADAQLVVLDANRFASEIADTPGLRYVSVGTPDLPS
jgi:UDPglucose 6-dehydrogenase